MRVRLDLARVQGDLAIRVAYATGRRNAIFALCRDRAGVMLPSMVFNFKQRFLTQQPENRIVLFDPRSGNKKRSRNFFLYKVFNKKGIIAAPFGAATCVKCQRNYFLLSFYSGLNPRNKRTEFSRLQPF